MKYEAFQDNFKVRSLKISKVSENLKHLELSSTAWLEYTLGIFGKLLNLIYACAQTHSSTPRKTPKTNWCPCPPNTSAFLAGLFATANSWKQPKCLLLTDGYFLVLRPSGSPSFLTDPISVSIPMTIKAHSFEQARKPHCTGSPLGVTGNHTNVLVILDLRAAWVRG